MLIDTSVIIACLNAEPKATVMLSEWRREGRALLLSAITTAEALALPSVSQAEVNRIRGFLRNFISIPFDDPIAEIAASLRRTYRLELPDAGIAATAMVRDVPLVTRDRQFRKVRELTMVEI